MLDAPVMVTVAGPIVAVLLAVSVSVLALVVLPGLNDAVTPAGKPDADRLTLPLKPFCGATVMVVEPVAPCTTVKLLGDADRAKLPWGFTVREIVVVLLRLAEVPVTVTVTVPTAAVPAAERVRTLLDVVGFVPKVAVTPFGKAETARFTLPLKPFTALMVTVAEADVPCRMVTLAVDAESVKLGWVVDAGQLFTKFAALTVPIPVAKSQPVVVP